MAMFHFAFAELVQVRLPMRIMFQVFGHMPRQKDVAGVAAIHHSLGDVDPGAGDIGLLVQIADLVNRTAVHTRADFQFWMTLQCLADFHGAENRRLRAVAKNQRDAVARRQAQKFSFRFRLFELFRPADDFL